MKHRQSDGCHCQPDHRRGQVEHVDVGRLVVERKQQIGNVCDGQKGVAPRLLTPAQPPGHTQKQADQAHLTDQEVERVPARPFYRQGVVAQKRAVVAGQHVTHEALPGVGVRAVQRCDRLAAQRKVQIQQQRQQEGSSHEGQIAGPAQQAGIGPDHINGDGRRQQQRCAVMGQGQAEEEGEGE